MSIIQEIARLKKENNALILAHTYQPGEIQDIADYVGDSYGLSVQAAESRASQIIFCGVRFMAETAAILNESVPVFLPASGAGCPMADMITPEQLTELKAAHPDHLVVCYVNTTVGVKALSDVCCTSSNAVRIVKRLPSDKGIIFVPDKYLGGYVSTQSGRTMVLWNGFCPTHARIKPAMIHALKEKHPDAAVLVHPEAPVEVCALADAVLSTSGMVDFAAADPRSVFIVATEEGILHTLLRRCPDKVFLSVDPVATVCPNMKKTTLDLVLAALQGKAERIVVAPDIAQKARRSLQKMLDLSL